MDFICVGIQKSATSFLFNILSQYDQICMPHTKKERFYIDGKHIKEEASLFEAKGGSIIENKILGDFSVEYFVDHSALEFLANKWPEVRLIIVLRNHVDRLKSAYNWYYRKGLTNLSEIEFYKRNDETSKELLNKYSFYKNGLEVIFNNFKNVNIIDYEQLTKKPKLTIKELENYLSVEKNFASLDITRSKPRIYNKSTLNFYRAISKNKVLSKIFEKTIEKYPILAGKKANEDLNIPNQLLGEFKTDAKDCNELFEREGIQFRFNLDLYERYD